jgi:ribosomal protein L16/L10AE
MKRDPKNWKYKRSFKLVNKINHLEPCMSLLGFSTYGLVVEKDIFLNYNHLLTLYRLLKKKFKKKKVFKINVSCILPFTKKPVSARMGKGKGAWRGFNVFLRKGTILLEINDDNFFMLFIILKECMQKLPVKTKIVRLKV